MTGLVTDRDIETFDQDGAIILRGVFDQHWLSLLADGLEKNFKKPGPYSTVYTEDGKPGGFAIST